MGKAHTSDIESGVGFLGGFLSTLMGFVRESKIPFEAIHRLGKAGGRDTVKKIVDLAYAEWEAEQPKPVSQELLFAPKVIKGRPTGKGKEPTQAGSDAPANGDVLPPNHYRVYITYAPLPSLDELKKKWGEHFVSDIFDGRPFTLHASCVGMDSTPGEKIFYLHDVGDDWESEEQIAWGEKQCSAIAPNGYRPATEQETYEFAKAHPEIVDFVGLGSFAMDGNDRCVADVWQSMVDQRILDHDSFDDGLHQASRALFVCK